MTQRYSDMKFREVDETIYSRKEQLISMEELSVNATVPERDAACICLNAPKWVRILPVDNAQGLLTQDYLKKVLFCVPVCVSYKYRYGEVDNKSVFTVVIEDPHGAVARKFGIVDEYDEDDNVDLTENTEDPIPMGQPIDGVCNFNLVKYAKLKPNPNPRIIKIFMELGHLQSQSVEIELRP